MTRIRTIKRRITRRRTARTAAAAAAAGAIRTARPSLNFAATSSAKERTECQNEQTDGRKRVGFHAASIKQPVCQANDFVSRAKSIAAFAERYFTARIVAQICFAALSNETSAPSNFDWQRNVVSPMIRSLSTRANFSPVDFVATVETVV